MSEFHVQVVRIGAVERLPNSDSLSITNVLGGYPVIFRTGDYKEGDLAVYVPVDALVPVSEPEFKFLDEGKKNTSTARIKARRLRGTFSMGLLVSADRAMTVNRYAKEGDNVQALYGIEKYVPTAEQEPSSTPTHQLTRKQKHNELAEYERNVIFRLIVAHVVGLLWAAAEVYVLHTATWLSALTGFALGSFIVGLAALFMINRNRKRNVKPNIPVYDIEGLRRYSNVFQDGEEVSITEKIHGCNARFVYFNKKLHIASRTMFRRIGDGSVWDVVAKKYGLEEKLSKIPGKVLFGEVYGKVQDLTYGVPANEGVRFVAFDLMDLQTREYADVDGFNAVCWGMGIPTVPELYRGPWSPELAKMAEGSTTMPGASHVREGIVVKPVVERKAHGLGRCFLKLAGEGYHLRKGG